MRALGPWKPCYIRLLIISGKKPQRNTKRWDQQNYLTCKIWFCYIWHLYNEVPLYFEKGVMVLCQDQINWWGGGGVGGKQKIQWSLGIKRLHMTKPRHNKVILLVWALYRNFLDFSRWYNKKPDRREFSWSEGPRYNEVSLYGELLSELVLIPSIAYDTTHQYFFLSKGC